MSEGNRYHVDKRYPPEILVDQRYACRCMYVCTKVCMYLGMHTAVFTIGIAVAHK
jgi:hypothetical protein